MWELEPLLSEDSADVGLEYESHRGRQTVLRWVCS